MGIPKVVLSGICQRKGRQGLQPLPAYLWRGLCYNIMLSAPVPKSLFSQAAGLDFFVSFAGL
jgi:hypothetical protein